MTTTDALAPHPDAWITYEPQLLAAQEHDALWALMMSGALDWDHRMKARKTLSLGRPYLYSNMTYPEAPWPALFEPLLARLQQRLGFRFNGCLANLYEDGQSSMGFHVDELAGLAPGSGIAIVSLGQTRTLSFKRLVAAASDALERWHYPLPAGSLLYMAPELQAHFKHGVNAQPELLGPRISLTFRVISG